MFGKSMYCVLDYKRQIKKWRRRWLHTSTPGPRRDVFMARHRILRRGLRDEARRTILREAEARYRHELLEDEERMLLLDRTGSSGFGEGSHEPAVPCM
jgi:hypothetical protein